MITIYRAVIIHCCGYCEKGTAIQYINATIRKRWRHFNRVAHIDWRINYIGNVDRNKISTGVIWLILRGDSEWCVINYWRSSGYIGSVKDECNGCWWYCESIRIVDLVWYRLYKGLILDKINSVAGSGTRSIIWCSYSYILEVAISNSKWCIEHSLWYGKHIMSEQSSLYLHIIYERI